MRPTTGIARNERARALRPRSFVRDVHGGASIELAIGSVALLSIAALCFDLYTRIQATAAGGRAAVSMADYVSRDTTPNGNEMAALGRFLHTHDIRVPSAMVYVVSAFHRPSGVAPGDPPGDVELLWTDDTIRIGPAADDTFASGCTQFVDAGNPRLPDDFATEMEPGEAIVMVEVCVRLTREGSLTGTLVAGDIYCVHALPTRSFDETPAPPVFTAAYAPADRNAVASIRDVPREAGAASGAALRGTAGVGAAT